MKNKALLTTALFLALAASVMAQTSVVVVPANTSWRFLDNGSDQGTAWRGLGFNDSSWGSGNAELGYGDGGEATTVNGGPSGDRYITTWFRRTFVVPPNAPSLASVAVHLVRDDGGIVYLNGVEIFRSNMPGGAVNYRTFASATVGGGAESQYFSNAVSSANLLIGVNVLAVEIHQVDPTSTDVSFNLALTGVTGPAARPVLAVQPTNTAIPIGSIGALVVGVTGNGPFGYEWRKDGVPLVGNARIQGTNTPTLNLSDIVNEDGGGYSVVVSNASGSVTSQVAVLTVLPPPTTVIDDFEPDIDFSQWSAFSGTVRAATQGGNVSPPNAMTFGGDTQRFAVTRPIDTTAGGFISFSIRISDGVNGEPWDHAELPGEGIVFEYSTNRSTNWTRLATYDTEDLYSWTLQEMFMPPGALAPQTLFRWRQLEHSGSCCDHWALDDVYIESLPFPPIIVQEPRDRSALEGGSATFTVEAAGTPALHYQWSFNGTGLPNATNASYTVHGASTQNVGAYRVSIDNALGSTSSREAQLTVVDGSRDTFRITALSTNNPHVVNYGALAGDERGGIAVSTSRVFVVGDTATAGFNLADLGNPTAVPVVYDALVSDLRSGRIFAFGTATGPLTANGGLATRLLEVDGQSGLVNGTTFDLSDPIAFSPFFPSYGNIGFYSGYGRAAVYNGTNVYTLFLPSGLVIDLGPLPSLTHIYSGTWAYWGVMEFFDGATWLTRAQDFRTIARTRAGDGLTQTVASFRDLGGMGGFSVVPGSNRWYFHTSYSTELGFDPTLAGYADAGFSFEQTTQAVSIVNGPRSRGAVAGATVEFFVSALGYPLRYQWLRNGMPLPGENGYRLRLTNVTTNDAADYAVIVSNDLGMVTSNPARLRVVPPVIVSVFDDPNYVDTFGGPYSGSDSVQASITFLGHQVAPFATSNLNVGFGAGRPVLIPSLAYNNPARIYSVAQRQIIQNFVLNGGLLIVNSANYGVNFINDIFGLSLVNQFAPASSFPQTSDALDTAFENGPASLPPNSSFRGLLASALPLGARHPYETNNTAAIATIPIGSGRIVYLGWDWINARPLGTQDGGWLDALNAALVENTPPLPGPPAIAVQPRSRPGVVGVDVPLSVIAYGTGPMFYQWFYNNVAIPGARSSGYTIGLPTTNSSGAYYVIVSNLIGSVTSQVAQVTIRPSRGVAGYYTDFDTDSTAPEFSILKAGFTPVRLTDITPASLASLRHLVINEANFNYTSPALLMRLPGITAWVQGGGRLIVHDIATGTSALMPGASNTRLQLYPTNTVKIVPPGNTLVTAGPYGTITNGSLSGSNYLAYTTADASTLPAGSVSFLEVDPAQTVAFAYGLGSGLVYYSTVLLGPYFDTELPESELLRSVYLPNVLEYAHAYTSSGPAVILQSPADTGALPNGTATLTVFASGLAPLRYQWYFNNNVLITGATNASLVISGASPNHVGLYHAVVSNPLGSTNSLPARLSLLDALVFKINTLGTGSSQVIDHDGLTSDDRGGIAISTNSVFITGDFATARYAAANLSGGVSLPVVYDALIGNLRNETVYSLAIGTNLIQGSGSIVDNLVQLDSTTGALTTNRIILSTPIPLSGGDVGIFSGYDAGVLHDGVRAWRIDFHTGFVTDLGFMPSFPHMTCENWAYWGVAEFFNGAMWLMHVRSSQNISRIRVPDGQLETVGTFNNLSDMCSFTFSPSRDRWYFHYEGSGQFGGQNETLGYASATWDHPPTISGLAGTTRREDAAPLTFLFNLADDITPTASLVLTATNSDPSLLTVTFGTSGTVRTMLVTLAPNRFGTSVVVVTVTDAIGNIARASYPIIVTPVNDPPTFTPGADVVVNEDAGAVSLPAWATQISAGPFETAQRVTFVVSNNNPALFLQQPTINAAGDLTFALAPNASGVAGLTLLARDDGGIADGGLDTSSLQTFLISVTPVNDPPSAAAQSVTTAEDTAVPITLAGTDPEGDPLTFTVVTPSAHGSLTGLGPNLIYLPATNYAGPDQFAFEVADGRGGTARATVLITIDPVNDVPQVAEQSLSLDEDTTLAIALGATDPDGDPLDYTLLTQPAHGTLQGTAPNFIYAPAANFHGADSFSFQVSDRHSTSAPVRITLTVVPVNDPPVATGLALTTDENTPISFQLAGSDLDGDKLRYTIVASPAHGVLTGKGMSQTYTPAAGFHGTDAFTFRVSDSLAAAEATVTIVVRLVNNPPTAVARVLNLVRLTPTSTRSVLIAPLSGSVPVIFDGSLSTDPDGTPLQYAWSSGGSVFARTVTATNVFAVGRHTVTLRVEDGQAASTATVEVEIITAADALNELIVYVSQSGLPSNRIRPLLSSLEAAAASFKRGNMNSGANQLGAFQDKVDAQVQPSDPALAAVLQATSQAIINAVGQ